MKILTGAPVRSIERTPDGLRVHAGKSGETILDADMVVHGAGRVPNLAGLDLSRGEISVDEQGILINPYLQSVSNPSVYVAGDANAHGRPLSPVATMEGRIAARNMIHGNTSIPAYGVVPSVVFVSPPLSSVGLREDQSAPDGMKVKVYRKETSGWFSNRRVGISRSGYTVLTEEASGKILGAHLLGYHADEMINLFALAIGKGIPLDELKETLWAYPTAGYDIIRIQ
jgi:Pyruvate/2-oxoglutarate dehydrogenase complex, dihydrolipoamide dehydrogenase (E3) component, and related enzymes